MGKVDRMSLATRDAAAMRFDPAAVAQPDLLRRGAHPELRPFSPIGQPHDELSFGNGRSELLRWVMVAIGCHRCRWATRRSKAHRSKLEARNRRGGVLMPAPPRQHADPARPV